MNDRQTGEGRQDRWTTQRERRDEGNGGSERAMTRSSQTGADLDQQNDRSSGNWTGYVVPYRYYGPGYRGVGYYSVFYQGSGDEQGGSATWDDDRGAMSGQRGTGAGRASGGFAGRGPKGYQRSDDRIREEVSDRLTADDRIDASEIEVQVKDCEVTLTGTVDDRWAKRQAEDVAEQVMGVRDVMNQIRVVSGESGQSDQSGQLGQYGRGDQAEFGQAGALSPAAQRSTSDTPRQGEANGRRQKTGSAPR